MWSSSSTSTASAVHQLSIRTTVQIRSDGACHFVSWARSARAALRPLRGEGEGAPACNCSSSFIIHGRQKALRSGSWPLGIPVRRQSWRRDISLHYEHSYGMSQAYKTAFSMTLNANISRLTPVGVDDDAHMTRLVHVTPCHLADSRDATWL